MALPRRFLAPLLALSAILASCSDAGLVPAPEEVRLAALDYARRYEEQGATYAWGGQDPLPARLAVDCSGLVVRCYGYACADYGYSLPFEDSTASGMQAYAVATSPEPGDLVFMGTGGVVSHIALFIGVEGELTYFIDSTEKEDPPINGVTTRCYPTDDARFIGYGRMLVERE